MYSVVDGRNPTETEAVKRVKTDSRILLVLFPSCERGGAEEYALTIAQGAVVAGWEAHAAFPQAPGTKSLIEDFRSHGVKYHRARLTETHLGRWRHMPNFLTTLGLLRRLKPTVVHLPLPWITDGLGSIVACAFSGQPSLVVFQLAPKTVDLARWRRGLCVRARSRKQRWVAVSEHNRENICRSYDCLPDEVTVVHNGASLPTQKATGPRAEIRRQVRQEFGLEENARILLTVARLEPEKGHRDLLPAIGHISTEFSGTKFVWAGEGPLRRELEADLFSLGLDEHVILAGYRDDVVRLLSASDLFVFPTRFEGFPFAVLEAMAAGVPVVASNASSLPEVITHNRHGLLFPPGDSDALRDAIRFALSNPDTMCAMAGNALSRVEDFSQEKMVEKTLALFDGMA
jgi:glycosyltransferase involved in cell wall biosynthesis